MRKFVGAYTQDSEVSVWIVTDERRGKLAPVGEKHPEFLASMHDVAVRQQITIGGNEKSGAGSARCLIAAHFNMNHRWMSNGGRAGHGIRVGIDQRFIGILRDFASESGNHDLPNECEKSD